MTISKILSFIFLIAASMLKAQTVEVGVLGGMMAYQGDLTPSGIGGLLGQSQIAGGAFIHINLHPMVALQGQVMLGTLRGDDQKGSVGQRSRNLHFRSPLVEYGLRAYVYPFRINIGVAEIKPFAGLGLARFHFNPRAEYNGAWVDLQPLSTEGQGLQENRPVYTLTDFAIPVVGGAKWKINDQWTMSAELVSHITFTDYLDDVSTTYPDYNLLQAQRGAIAVALSDRSPELGSTTMRPPGSARGNAKKDDWFVTVELKLAYNLSANARNKVRCPDFN